MKWYCTYFQFRMFTLTVIIIEQIMNSSSSSSSAAAAAAGCFEVQDHPAPGSPFHLAIPVHSMKEGDFDLLSLLLILLSYLAMT